MCNAKKKEFSAVLPKRYDPSSDIVKYYPRIMKVFILTISDRAYYGEYQDRSGPRAAALTEEYFKSQAYIRDLPGNNSG